MPAGRLSARENDPDLEAAAGELRWGGSGRDERSRRLSEEVREQLRDLIWVPGGRGLGSVDDLEGGVKDGGEGEGVVEPAGLDLAVDGGQPTGGRSLDAVCCGCGGGAHRRRAMRSDLERERCRC